MSEMVLTEVMSYYDAQVGYDKGEFEAVIPTKGVVVVRIPGGRYTVFFDSRTYRVSSDVYGGERLRWVNPVVLMLADLESGQGVAFENIGVVQEHLGSVLIQSRDGKPVKWAKPPRFVCGADVNTRDIPKFVPPLELGEQNTA